MKTNLSDFDLITEMKKIKPSMRDGVIFYLLGAIQGHFNYKKSLSATQFKNKLMDAIEHCEKFYPNEVAQ